MLFVVGCLTDASRHRGQQEAVNGHAAHRAGCPGAEADHRVARQACDDQGGQWPGVRQLYADDLSIDLGHRLDLNSSRQAATEVLRRVLEPDGPA